MRRIIHFTAFLLSFALSSNAFADCGWPEVKAFDTLSGGTTVCTSDSQEQHLTAAQDGFNLWDYKKGPSDPVDPTAPAGNWSANNNTTTHSNGTVTYTYGSNSYTFTLHKDPSTSSTKYFFCSTGTGDNVEATSIINSISQCPGF